MTKRVFSTLLAGLLLFAACGKDDDNKVEAGKVYTLTVLANKADWGTATGSGTYVQGDRVDVEAVPAQGYYFIKWDDGAVSNPRTVTVSGNRTLYALFSNRSDDPNPYNPAEGGGDDPTPTPTPVPEGFVDLGLPSGLLWATCNLGATTPEGYGDHYAWGETTTKSTYNWSTYTYCNGSYDALTKYCTNSYYGDNGITDDLTTLEAMDDAATQVLGNGARIPTSEEWDELLNNTTSEWTTRNGVNGRKLTAANGRSLFLPAAGYRWDGDWNDAGTRGYYWSASLNTDYPNYAWSFSLNAGGQLMYSRDRGYGRSVRSVRSAH